MKYKDRKDAKSKYKQALLATVATMSLGVSVSGGTTSAFADEKKTEVQPQSSIQEKNVASQERGIQGYLFKDGVKTPVYKSAGTYYDSRQSDAAYPKLGSNPKDPIPKEGSIHSETGNIGSTLYFSHIYVPALPLPGSDIRATVSYENAYLEKKADGSVEVGIYDPKTLVRVRTNVTHPSYKFDQKALKAYFEGTTVKRDTSYQLKSNKVLPRSASYKYTEGIKSGLTKEHALGGALTIGAKMGAKASGGVPGVGSAEFSFELSTQLSLNYNHKITVTDEKTSTEEISFPGVNNTTYKYDEYAVALYQLQSTYTVQPGPALKKALEDKTWKNLPGIHGKTALAQTAFSYSDSTTYLAVTPGAASK